MQEIRYPEIEEVQSRLELQMATVHKENKVSHINVSVVRMQRVRTQVSSYSCVRLVLYRASHSFLRGFLVQVCLCAHVCPVSKVGWVGPLSCADKLVLHNR